MSRKKKTSLALVVLLVLAAVWWWKRGATSRPGELDAAHGDDPAMLVDRLWLDSKPEKYTDYTHVMIVFSGAPFGIFQKASAYQATSWHFGKIVIAVQ